MLSLSLLSLPAYAEETSTLPHEITVNSEGYNFTFSESIDQNYTITRVYTNSNTSTPASAQTDLLVNYAETEALLLALGMEEREVSRLSPEELTKYAESPQIICSVSYSKSDANGDLTYVTEDEALAAANRALLQATGTMIQDQDQDSYMRVWHAATELDASTGRYLFETSARWLTMPALRFTDSIGSCASQTASEPGTQSGYYEYDLYQTSTTGAYTHRVVTHTFDGSFDEDYGDFQPCGYGTWAGVGATFTLPSDIHGTATTVTCLDFFAHISFEGELYYPMQVVNFNSSGTYSHAKIQISPSVPELSISFGIAGWEASASLGLPASMTQENRSIQLLLHHYPT